MALGGRAALPLLTRDALETRRWSRFGARNWPGAATRPTTGSGESSLLLCPSLLRALPAGCPACWLPTNARDSRSPDTGFRMAWRKGAVSEGVGALPGSEGDSDAGGSPAKLLLREPLTGCVPAHLPPQQGCGYRRDAVSPLLSLSPTHFLLRGQCSRGGPGAGRGAGSPAQRALERSSGFTSRTRERGT